MIMTNSLAEGCQSEADLLACTILHGRRELEKHTRRQRFVLVDSDMCISKEYRSSIETSTIVIIRSSKALSYSASAYWGQLKQALYICIILHL